MTRSLPGLLLRLEGAALLAASLVAWWALGGGWGWFVLLLLAPDLCFLALFAGRRVAVVAYNVAHSTVGPLLLLGVAVVAAERFAGLAALVWLAHIGLDRMVGFGLKYSMDRGDTHFRRL